jgi:hypothetical protein
MVSGFRVQHSSLLPGRPVVSKNKYEIKKEKYAQHKVIKPPGLCSNKDFLFPKNPALP